MVTDWLATVPALSPTQARMLMLLLVVALKLPPLSRQ